MNIRDKLKLMEQIKQRNNQHLKDWIADEGPIKEPLQDQPVTNHICRLCGEAYTEADLEELDEMGERYYCNGDSFFCPDCWDDFQRLTLEQQAKILLADEP